MILTPTGFLIVVLLLCAAAIGVVTAEIFRDRDETREDDLYAQDVLDYHCAGHGHKYESVDWHWLCSHCGDVVRQPLNCGGRHRYEARGQSLTCSVCGHRTAKPYDQESGVA